MQLLNKVLFAFFVFAIIKKGDDISLYFFYFGICSIITGIICTLRIVLQYNESFRIGNFKKSIRLIKKSFMLFNFYYWKYYQFSYSIYYNFFL